MTHVPSEQLEIAMSGDAAVPDEHRDEEYLSDDTEENGDSYGETLFQVQTEPLRNNIWRRSVITPISSVSSRNLVNYTDRTYIYIHAFICNDHTDVYVHVNFQYAQLVFHRTFNVV